MNSAVSKNIYSVTRSLFYGWEIQENRYFHERFLSLDNSNIYGVMSTPALVVDGKVPSKDEARSAIQKARAWQ